MGGRIKINYIAVTNFVRIFTRGPLQHARIGPDLMQVKTERSTYLRYLFIIRPRMEERATRPVQKNKARTESNKGCLSTRDQPV